jgi:CRP-like cAMP-binding protein
LVTFTTNGIPGGDVNAPNLRLVAADVDQSTVAARPLSTDPHAAEQNRLLGALPGAEYTRLVPHLKPVRLSAKQVLWEPEARIQSVYFPRTAVLSLLTPLANGLCVEAATVGCEGMAGTPVVLGVTTTSVRAIAQIPGAAVRVDADRFSEWLRDDGVLFPLMLRYVQALQEQTAQSVACTRRHGIDARCARWLLMTRDRVATPEFPLTHELLAIMLGVRRASVTEAALALQAAGLIRYARGTVTVVDRTGLEAASCECYHVVRRRYERLLLSREQTQ